MFSKSRKKEQFTAAKHKILVIDDEESILKLMRDILSPEGYHVFTADNGKTGIEIAQKENVDLIIVDILMPGIDGIETIKRIRQFNTSVSILILTAYAKRKDALVNAVKYSVFDYIIKPFDIDYLLMLIKYVLHRTKFDKMPYVNTISDFYWKEDISQKDIVQRKWNDLKNLVSSSIDMLKEDRNIIEKHYIKLAPSLQAVKFFMKSVIQNTYFIIFILCVVFGVAFGFFINKIVLSNKSGYKDYIGKLSYNETAAVPDAAKAGKVSLGDFYDLMKDIESRIKKEIESQDKSRQLP